MIAFYTWTDTQLINAVRLRSSVYPEEEADLFVLNLPRINEKLVSTLSDMGIFRYIIRIDEPHDGLPEKLHKLVKPFRQKYYYQAFCSKIGQTKRERYETLFVGAFWSWSLFMYRYLAEVNPDIRICLMEEGIINYGGAETAYVCDSISSKRDWITRHTLYRKSWKKAVKAVDRLYLSEPKLCLSTDNLKVFEIPDPQGVLDKISEKMLSEGKKDLYTEKKVIFFLQPEGDMEFNRSLQILDALVQRFGRRNVLVRLHPDSDKDAVIRRLPDGTDIDEGQEPYEILLYAVDWNHKLLVGCTSSCLFLPSLILKQNPTVMFLYKLYGNPGDGFVSRIIERFRSLQESPERILVPESCEIMETVLDNIHDL